MTDTVRNGLLKNKKIKCMFTIMKNIEIIQKRIGKMTLPEYYEKWKNLSYLWSEYLLSHDSLTKNLLSFIGEKLSKDEK